MKKIAVVLSGCGFQDGAEIRESVLALLALNSFVDAKVEIFAPDRHQHHVVDHLNGHDMKEKRNILQESARIARGEIKGLHKAKAEDYDGLVLPGGYGAAKNFSNFAQKGSEGRVNEDIASFIRSFHQRKKPILAICITPAIVAMVLKTGEVTVGDDSATIQNIENLGVKHIVKKVTEYHVDSENLLVSTPAYMYEADLKDIYKGISEATHAFGDLL